MSNIPKLTDGHKQEIVNLYTQGRSAIQLGKQYGVSKPPNYNTFAC